MNKNITISTCGIFICISALYYGFPFEFYNLTFEKIARVIAVLIIVLSFYKLFKLSKEINSKIIRRIMFIITTLTFLPYCLLVIYNLATVNSSNYKRWKDLELYKNLNNEKTVYQLRETSGSSYDYRYRKILWEGNNFRVSINTYPNNKTNWGRK